MAMCGRFLNNVPADEIARLFGTRNAVPNYPARYNLAPTEPVLAVRYNAERRERSLDALRWGLVPHWAKDLSIGAKLINARGESLAEKASFRDAFAKRRCLIPAAGFYEWQKSGGTKTPYAVLPRGAPLFAFAGLWENWRAPDSGEWVRSCTIVTTSANATLAPIHERMPVILEQDSWPQWLGETPASPSELSGLLKPLAAEHVRLFPVSTRVNSVRNDDAGLIEPVMAEGGVRV
jgi:putative SOS response-associated peptidase YedK